MPSDPAREAPVHLHYDDDRPPPGIGSRLLDNVAFVMGFGLALIVGIVVWDRL